MSQSRLVNCNLDDEQLELANWLRTEPSEHRQIGNDIFVFLWPSSLMELRDLLLKLNSDYFIEGAMELEFNGGDLIINATDICRSFGISSKLIYDDYEAEDEDD